MAIKKRRERLEMNFPNDINVGNVQIQPEIEIPTIEQFIKTRKECNSSDSNVNGGSCDSNKNNLDSDIGNSKNINISSTLSNCNDKEGESFSNGVCYFVCFCFLI